MNWSGIILVGGAAFCCCGVLLISTKRTSGAKARILCLALRHDWKSCPSDSGLNLKS